MPRVPLGFRRTASDPHTSEDQVLLVKITHADLAEPIRLSTDPTERLSIEPLTYGTVSNSETYTFVEMAALLPDDKRSTPPRVALGFENLDSSYVELARSFISPATAELSIAFVSDPDSIMKRFTRFRTTKCSYTESNITLDLSKEYLQTEPFGRRQTKDAFPGLHSIASA